MHRFIVYQFGKVGSSAVVNALGQIPGVEAYQSHFLGPEAFRSTLDSLINPTVDDYFFEHSAGQLLHNLRVYRHYLRRRPGGEPLTVVTMSREPFAWFRSALGQEIDGHLAAFRTCLQSNALPFADDAELVARGCELLLGRVGEAIRVAGGIDALSVETRLGLDRRMAFADEQDFQAFLFFLGRFLMPHVWFRSQFEPAMGMGIQELAPQGPGLYRRSCDWGNVYLLRFEELSSAFAAMLADLDIAPAPALEQVNVGSDKAYSEALNAAFDSAAGRQLQQLSTSSDSSHLGYHGNRGA